jgi:hypothetical protein
MWYFAISGSGERMINFSMNASRARSGNLPIEFSSNGPVSRFLYTRVRDYCNCLSDGYIASLTVGEFRNESLKWNRIQIRQCAREHIFGEFAIGD